MLFPVNDRTSGTLIPIIEKIVEKGAQIFSDGWSAYLKLNEYGYDHFVMNHSTSYVQEYLNVVTNEKVSCNTNLIEGAWNKAKDHFRKKHGQGTFESHLAEVIWRTWDKDTEVLQRFFNSLRKVCDLNGPPKYTAVRPPFSTFEDSETSFINHIDFSINNPDFIPEDSKPYTSIEIGKRIEMLQ